MHAHAVSRSVLLLVPAFKHRSAACCPQQLTTLLNYEVLHAAGLHLLAGLQNKGSK
jgi:hypothetical protein